jgi:trk system potassium uptake protein TrkH
MLSSRAVRSLQFAIRPGPVAKYLGQLLTGVAIFSVVPLLVTVFSGEYRVGVHYLLVIFLFAGFGIPSSRLRCGNNLQKNEALAVTVLAFVISSLGLTVPITAYGISFVDALFEAVSAVTTTGLTALSSMQTRPASFLFARAWVQWVGGLGIVVLAVAMMMESGPAAKKLGFSEREVDDLAGGTRAHAKRVVMIYALLTLLALAAMLLAGVGFFDAMTHVLTAVSTGGFSTHDISLSALPSALSRGVIMASCALGAVSFSIYYRGYQEGIMAAIKAVELRALIAACFVTAALVMLLERAASADGAAASLGDAMLISISAQATAGFSDVPVANLGDGSKLVLIASMFAGGDVGSTSGGIKIFRLLLLVRLVQLMMVRASTPRGTVVDVRVGETRVTPRELEVALAVVFAYAAVILISWLPFLAYGYHPLNALFEVVSAVSTAGLSTGVVRPELENPLKLVLCFDMWMGRVEIIAFLLVLYPATWIGRRRRTT